MHVALTGASGFIGSHIARCLRTRGHTVTALVRTTSRTDHIRDSIKSFVTGDQGDSGWWDEFLDGADCVIHNSIDWNPLRRSVDLDQHLQSNLVSAIRLLHRAAPRQFIFISTIAVHHDMRPRWGGVIDEDHPLRPSSLYGACKAAIETHLWAAHYADGQHTSAFRPCGVYGLDPNIERTYGINMMRKVKAGQTALSKPGGGKFIHVEDVAAAVVAAVGNEQATARAFNLVDCYARWADWAQMACEIAGRDDVEIDFSSPEKPQNDFTKDAVRSLGVDPSRGHDGIREFLQQLHDLV